VQKVLLPQIAVPEHISAQFVKPLSLHRHIASFDVQDLFGRQSTTELPDDPIVS
jgi:hypothetical protein